MTTAEAARPSITEVWAGLPPAQRNDRQPRAEGLRLAASTAAPYLLLAPGVLFLSAIVLYPLVDSFLLTFQDRSGAYEATGAGFRNYDRLLSDPDFWAALRITAIYTLVVVSLELVFGFVLALSLVNSDSRRSRALRIVYLLPMLLAPLIVGVIWRLLLEPDTGLAPYLAGQVGGENFNPLGSETLALPSIMVVDIWEWTPFVFLLCLAGLKSLPTEPYEAARVDGASSARILVTLTLPLLRPVLLVAILIRTIDAFTVFDQVYALTGGGPGDSTQVLSLLAYNNAFKYTELGFAAVIVLAMVVVLLAVSAILIGLMRRREVVA